MDADLARDADVILDADVTPDARPVIDAEVILDADGVDAADAEFDAGRLDAGPGDAESPEVGPSDAGSGDSGMIDGGSAPGPWRTLARGPLSARVNSASAWTGTRLIVWSGDTGDRNGALFDPVTNQWTATSTVGAPAARQIPTTVWTGSRLFVWGGVETVTPFNALGDGAMYDPATDRWRSVAASPILLPTGRGTAAWTGSRVFVMDAAAVQYDPVLDRWSNTNFVGQPTARIYSTVVWTGSQVLVWGGLDRNTFSGIRDGARYDPTFDTWTAMSTAGAPSGRGVPVAVWTGTELLIWGGYEVRGTLQILGNGALYNPATNTWRPMSTVGAPLARMLTAYAWTGTELIVWGGADGLRTSHADGAAFDPSTNSWRSLPAAGAPSRRLGMAYGWTGTELLIWGGATDLGLTQVRGDGRALTP